MSMLRLAVVLVVLRAVLGQQLPESENICLGSTSCGECITRDPSCVWCTESEHNGSRCDILLNHIKYGCDNITYPQGLVTIVQNDALADADKSTDSRAVQVSPQMINVTLRVGEPQTVRLNVRLANNYPLDLYYLMDLSKSQIDDLQSLKLLGQILARDLKKLTEDVQLGFGAFVDKVSTPYVVVDEQTCEPDPKGTCCSDCGAPFSFRNELSLTNYTDRFAERIQELGVSSSIDSPEGGLDALVQAISCQDNIRWRKRARRMIVYVSDAGFHVAGDGKMVKSAALSHPSMQANILQQHSEASFNYSRTGFQINIVDVLRKADYGLAGISKPNDGLCHIEHESNEYLKSTYMDYPSVGQINALLQENNIIPVFAVTSGVNALYQETKELIKGAFVGVLASDSSNVVNLVVQSYKSITSIVNIGDTAPGNIDVSYTANCTGEKPVPGLSQCDNVILGEPVSFDVEITARECTADTEKPLIFKVQPFGFDESLTIAADITCSCDCESTGIRDPTQCSFGNGILTCGKCVCNEGRYGEECECDGDTGSNTDFSSCMAPNSTSVCQGRGVCVCGECKCEKPTNPRNVISGKYCECDNFSCTRHHGEPCGGKERGECICGNCICRPDYIGEACDCLSSTTACETPSGLMCNGFGECKCGRCLCGAKSPFQGPTCENCPTCVGKCSSFRECVLCKVFDMGYYDAQQCDMCAVTIETVDDISSNDTETQICQYIDDDNCTIKYTYDLLENATYIVYVQESRVCRRIVEATPQTNVNVKWLLIGIILGILLVGILVVTLIRLAFNIQDKREFAKFEKEQKNAMWSNNDNPIFKSSTSTFLNPMHGQ